MTTTIKKLVYQQLATLVLEYKESFRVRFAMGKQEQRTKLDTQIQEICAQHLNAGDDFSTFRLDLSESNSKKLVFVLFSRGDQCSWIIKVQSDLLGNLKITNQNNWDGSIGILDHVIEQLEENLNREVEF